MIMIDNVQNNSNEWIEDLQSVNSGAVGCFVARPEDQKVSQSNIGSVQDLLMRRFRTLVEFSHGNTHLN